MLFIILADKFKIPVIIQPHGMFLNEALNSGSKFKAIVKNYNFFLYILCKKKFSLQLQMKRRNQ